MSGTGPKSLHDNNMTDAERTNEQVNGPRGVSVSAFAGDQENPCGLLCVTLGSKEI